MMNEAFDLVEFVNSLGLEKLYKMTKQLRSHSNSDFISINWLSIVCGLTYKTVLSYLLREDIIRIINPVNYEQLIQPKLWSKKSPLKWENYALDYVEKHKNDKKMYVRGTEDDYESTDESICVVERTEERITYPDVLFDFYKVQKIEVYLNVKRLVTDGFYGYWS